MRHPTVASHGMPGCGMICALCAGLNISLKRITNGQQYHVFCAEVKISDSMLFTSEECKKLIIKNLIVDFILCVNDFVRINIFSPL